MESPNRSVALVVVVALAGLAIVGAAIRFATSDTGGASDSSDADRNRSRPSRAPESGTSAKSLESVPAEPRAPDAPIPTPRRVDVTPIEWPVQVHALRGRVIGLDEKTPFTTPIVVSPVYSPRPMVQPLSPHQRAPNRPSAVLDATTPDQSAPPLNAALFHDDCFAVDFKKLLLDSPDVVLVALDVVADDPSYTRARRHLELPRNLVRTGGTLEVELDVSRSGSAVGRVEARSSDDASASRDRIELGLFSSVSGSPSGAPIDVVSVNSGERYRLRAPRTGDYFVVAAAPADEPALQRVHVDVGREREVAPIVLEPAASIVGKVVLPQPSSRETGFADREPTATALLCVVAELEPSSAGSSTRLELPSHSLLLRGDRVVTRASRFELELQSPRRDFALRGLHDGDRFRVGVAPPSGSVALDDVLTRTSVTAPAGDVALTLDAAGLDVDVFSPFSSGVDADVSIGTTKTTARASPFAPLFFLAPDRDYELLVAKDGFEPTRESVRSGAAGTVERKFVRLTPVESDATLELEVDAADLGELGAISVGVENVDSHFGKNWRTAPRADGLFRLSGLPLGHSHVTIEHAELASPRENTNPVVDRTWLVGGAFEFDVAPHDRLRRRVTLARGGKLRVSAVDGDGGSLAVNGVLRDSSGAPVDVLFVEHGPRSPDVEDVPSRGALGQPIRSAREPTVWSGHVVPADQGCETDHALPAGKYRALLDAPGFTTKSVDFELRAGEVTSIVVTMVRRTAR